MNLQPEAGNTPALRLLRITAAFWELRGFASEAKLNSPNLIAARCIPPQSIASTFISPTLSSPTLGSPTLGSHHVAAWRP